jgi:peptidoglycan/xylan/chitin deacetylase (PgdA/CDA1 family)
MMAIWLGITALGLLVLGLVGWAGRHWWLPAHRAVRVLMYHQVSASRADFLTVPMALLERQLAYLGQRGYRVISCRELLAGLAGQAPLPPRPVVLTFDDGYQNNADLLYPLLQKYRLKATIFIPTKFIGHTNEWDGGTETLMDAATLRALDPELVELAPHSHAHVSYKHQPLAAIDQDIATCLATLAHHQLPYVPVLSYPFGGMPKGRAAGQQFRQVLAKHGLQLGLRIGNRVNALPLADPYAVRRIDIRGDEPFWVFRLKLWLGRAKPF